MEHSKPFPNPAPKPPGGSADPEVTVLITAHNEEETIQACLRAVMAQDFPMERVEILLIDDRSTDATVERAESLGLASLRILKIVEAPVALTARQTALDLGLREARGEIVLITDADGRVPREWMRELSGHMSFRDGAVAGPVIFGGNHHAIARYQSIESLVTFTLYRLLYRHGMTTGVHTANVAVRRSAYLESGGFAAGGFNSAEGVALAAILRKGGWSMRYLIDPMVQTSDSGSVARLIRRGRRKARCAVPLINSLWLLLIATNILLLGWAALGSAPLIYGLLALAARYGLGLAIFAAAVGQYRAYPAMPSLLIFEPFLTFFGACVYSTIPLQPHWKWADVRYGRTGPAPQAAPSVAP